MFINSSVVAAILLLIVAGVAAPINLIFPPDAENQQAEFYFIDQVPKKIFAASLPESFDIVKRIEINLKTQRMKLFIDNKEIAEFVISSGKQKTPTKAGQFFIISKYPVAYGVIDGILWKMPYFMGIYKVAGTENGIHELPFANGWRESVRDMGHPVSHGCVRLSVGEAERVYNFAQIGTPVWVHY